MLALKYDVRTWTFGSDHYGDIWYINAGPVSVSTAVVGTWR